MDPGAGCDDLIPCTPEKVVGSVVASIANECIISLGPITPDSYREHGDFKKQLKLSCNGNKVAFVDHCSPQTPKDGVFDPFVPGPDDMAARAPRCRKYLDELKGSLSRQLCFDHCDLFEHENSGDDVESLSDQEIFESVYENVLEAIVSMQTEDILAEMESVEYDPFNCKTTPSEIRFGGIADTCPVAPLKPPGRPRIIPAELCRKLEFCLHTV